MIRALEEEIITGLRPLVANLNGVTYHVSESDGSQLAETGAVDEDGNAILRTIPSVTVDFQGATLDGTTVRESAQGYLVGPYEAEWTFDLTVIQPRGENYDNFDNVLKKVLSLPKVLFDNNPDRGYAWTGMTADDFEETQFMDARMITLNLTIKETGYDPFEEDN